ncbi:hypothetical protein ACIQPR_09455 [Streptomyces sp. NPDC091280]|uniref:hypothetical protein n=1 Tax=Streptomyces sp. NPDC091280 TaxID=3365984 RepID=UPI003815BBAB
MVKGTALDGAGVLVRPVRAEGEKAKIARIPRREASTCRTGYPSEPLDVGQEVNVAVAAEPTDNKKAPGKTRNTAFDDRGPRADSESSAEVAY